uniref:TonB-dependent receptor plug n=1 Tax=Caulobacter sp. (strain K31) TaxID=366602 RepID=B0T8Z3_CAUSK
MLKAASFVSTSLIALAAATSVSAQTVQTDSGASTKAAESVSVEEVVVTGSRVRTTYNSPTPVNVVGQERMQQLAIPDVATALNQIPSFRATTSASTILFRVSGAIGGNTPDLRGLGTSRTLVLVDGRRFVPSLDSGGVDLNSVPNALVKRTEIVTGGASAAYGADAVAGVVNLILDTKFNGVRIDASTGVSEHGDGKNYFISASGGRGFASDRGHIIAGIEYRDDKGVGNCFTRDWCAKLTNFVPNPGYIGGVSTNGLPATLVLDNVNFVYSPTGVLLSAVQTVGGVKTTLGQQVGNTGATALPTALRGLQFNAAGSALTPFQFGNYLSGTFMQGGDPAASNNWGWGNPPLVTPTSHASGLVHVDYDLTPKTQAFGEFIVSRTEGGPVRTSVLLQAPAGGSAGLDINNPFITPAVRAQILGANPNITAINVNVAVAQGGDTVVASSTNDIYRFVTGLKGDLFGDWRWDASYEYGRTNSETIVKNTRLAAFDTQATNAITPPAGYTGTIYTTPAGAPVICASSVANPSDGCLPVDLLGSNITPAVLSKYFKDERQTRKITQNDVMVNFRGTLFSLPAGPIQAAFGAEYRRDSVSGDVDALTAAGRFAAPQVTALPEVVQKVTEGYAEANIPLLADLPFAKSLSVDVTGRLTHYSGFGSARPWKIGLEYQPNDQILVRVTRSADIRAPSAAESNPNTVQTFLPLNDPFSGSNHLIGAPAGGNPNLELESAKTNTAGIVLKPNFLPGFHASVDWYDITVKNAIDAVTAPNILSACATKNLLCNLITFSGAAKASPVVSVLSNFQNVAQVHAEGYEFQSDYTIPDVWDGAVTFQLNANYVKDLKSIGGTGLVTRMNGVTGNAGSLAGIAGVPKYKIDGLVAYTRPSWMVAAHMRYIPESILDPTKIGPKQAGYNINLPTSIMINSVSSRFYLDLSGSAHLPSIFGSSKTELYGGVTNVFDKDQPPELRLFGNPLQYDTVGRAFRLGIRAAW